MKPLMLKMSEPVPTMLKVNEIFYSLQGEGRWTGAPATFIRLAGCNLRCPFCDTRHETFTLLTEDAIVAAVAESPSAHVVITGGEPTMQLTTSLLKSLKAIGAFIQIETNGSIGLPAEALDLIDWITCSPKTPAPIAIGRIDELKVVYYGEDVEHKLSIPVTHAECRYLQPCDTGDSSRNSSIISSAISYIKQHPQWKLSLQTHKLLNIR